MFDQNFFGVIVLNYLFISNVNSLLHLDFDSDRYPFNQQIYEDVLDPELCQRQLAHLRTENPILLARFLDAGIRLPRGMLMGNTIDLGNFHQCLAIKEQAEDMDINGKYCRIKLPLRQELHLPDPLDRVQWKFDPRELQIDEKTLGVLADIQSLRSVLHETHNDVRIGPESPLANVSLQLAVCIPRPCSSEQAINGLFNLSSVGFQFSEMSCRIPGDRPWVAIDYVATVIFSAIGLLTIISTCYDLYQSIYLQTGPKDISTVYSSFSVYTNTRRLLTFSSSPGSLECLDGVRALAMIWVILGHSFFSIPYTANPIEAFQWSISLEAAWITVAPLTVDTFFFLSGLLLVYTTVGKLGRMQLLKNLHVFYLHRLLRMFPILAAVILFEASLYMRVSDGPLWDRVAVQAFKCREFWWSTLLHLQNIVNPREACIGVSWYLAIDVQLHILSPLVLFWALSGRRAASTALLTALLATLTASTVFIFFSNFPSGIVSPNRQEDMAHFYIYYYVNILTRASPFLVGMVYGYLLHLWRKKAVHIPKLLTTIFLLCSLLILLAAMYCAQIAMRWDWDNQLADNFFNSFLRPLWALALGWIIFACVQGRAAPLNWFLSLRLWKLPARLSYAMYLTHYSIMVVYYSSNVTLPYFKVSPILFNFMGFMSSTLILSFFVTLLIDSPFSTIFKLILGGSKTSKNSEMANENKNGPSRVGNRIHSDAFGTEEINKPKTLNMFARYKDLEGNKSH